jgi:hypothetical protein
MQQTYPDVERLRAFWKLKTKDHRAFWIERLIEVGRSLRYLAFDFIPTA